MIISLFFFLIIIILIIIYKLQVLFMPQFVVSGTTKDNAGAAIGGVALNLHDLANSITYTAVSDDAGAYAFQPVKAGVYTITAYKDNGDGSHYSGQIDDIQVMANKTVDVTLERALVSR